MTQGRLITTALLAALAGAIAGCAAPKPSSSSPPAPVSEPAPATKPAKRANLNLSGFPVPYQEGYAAGCDSRRGSRHREEGRYKSDANYKMGWDDAYSICASRK